MVDLITLAIPVFFVSIGVEHLVGKAKGRRILRGPDVVADLSLGVMQTLFGVVAAVAIMGGYEYLYEHHRLWTIADTSPIAWIALFVGVDFFYYWFHRAAHRCNIAWASHAPHHSSEDFNFAVALRQGPVQPVVSHLFYLPLALVGFPVEMFAVIGSLNTILQFFVHTELVGKLGFLELFMNTPSHHRVHHGVNGRYIDRNHAGVFIIWDRMFGTFEPERERPIYGTVKQVATWNPLKAAVLPFLDIARMAARAPRLWDKIRIWVMPPEWIPAGVDVDVPDVVTRPKHDARPSVGVSRYVMPMFIVTLLLVGAFLLVGASKMSGAECWVATAWLTVSFASLGALLDGKAWPKVVEVVRLAALVPFILSLV